MREEVYKFIIKQGKDNWWYRGRRVIFEGVLKKFLKIPKNGKLLEIGSAGGGNFEVWRKFSDFCVGVDISEEALNAAKRFGYKQLILSDAENLPVASEDMSAVVLCDVLEHIENDEKVVKEMRRILKNNGVLFLTVPAFKFLWGGADKLSFHKRRYNKRQIEKLLKNEGFKILRLSYFNTLLFFPILGGRILERLFKFNPEMEYKPLPKILNLILFQIFSFESFLLKFFNFPFGVSIMAIAEKYDNRS